MRPVDQPAGDQALRSAPLSSSPVPLPSVFTSAIAPAPASTPEADEKPATPEENGEAELEPMRNGAEHTSETESSDSGATPRDKENSTGAPQEIEGKMDFLLGQIHFNSGTTMISVLKSELRFHLFELPVCKAA